MNGLRVLADFSGPQIAHNFKLIKRTLYSNFSRFFKHKSNLFEMYQFSRILSAKTSLFIPPQDFDVIPFKALLALGTILVEVWSIFSTHNLKKPNRSR